MCRCDFCEFCKIKRITYFYTERFCPFSDDSWQKKVECDKAERKMLNSVKQNENA